MMDVRAPSPTENTANDENDAAATTTTTRSSSSLSSDAVAKTEESGPRRRPTTTTTTTTTKRRSMLRLRCDPGVPTMDHNDAAHMILSASATRNLVSNDRDSYEFYKDLATAVDDAKGGDGYGDDDDDDDDVSNLRSAFGRVAAAWEERILRKTGRRLKDTCPFYGASEVSFREQLRDRLAETFDRAEDDHRDDAERSSAVADLRGLLNRVSELDLRLDKIRDDENKKTRTTTASTNDETMKKKETKRVEEEDNDDDVDDPATTVCWQCGRRPVRTKRCTSCGVARYCSRDCQKEAWRGGHREACPELRGRHERYARDVGRADRAAEEGRISSSSDLRPVPTWDHASASILAVREDDDDPLRLGGTIPRPTLDTFYRNLARAADGGVHPAFGSTDAAVVVDAGGVAVAEPVEPWELDACHLTFLFLAYDLDPVTPAADDDDVDVETKSEALVEFTEIVEEEIARVSGVCGLPLRRVLEIYALQGGLEDVRPRGARQRREANQKVLDHFRRNHHTTTKTET